MKKFILPLIILTTLVITINFTKADNPTEEKKPKAQTDNIAFNGITINKPKIVENLSVFILTGKETINGKSYNILSEAMKNKEVVVNETGDVNRLSIDNNSDKYVFINSGDIVRGGKQDRTISYDVIIPPNTKNIPLESFCVEQGRWQQRENESLNAFSSNSKMLSSKDLKLAARHKKNQGEVWSKVSEQKQYLNEKLSKKTGYAVNVEDDKSNTSLELALDNKELEKLKKEYYSELKDLINTPNAVGYAYAINGEIYGVDMYNNHQLFKDLWKKILESIIVEAISKEEENAKNTITENDVLAFMKAVNENDKKENKKLNVATNFKTTENKKGNVVFTTEDTNHKKWVHKSFMKSDTTSQVSKLNVLSRQQRN